MIEIDTPAGLFTSRAAAHFVTVFGILLYRYSGLESIIFETAIDGDIQTDNDPSNRKLIAIDFADNPSFLTIMDSLDGLMDVDLSKAFRCFVPEDLCRLLIPIRSGQPLGVLISLQFGCCDGIHTLALAGPKEIHGSESVSTFAKHFRQLLQSAMDAPQQPASQLRMMNASELQEILTHRNGLVSEFERSTISDAFEAHARKTPDSPALHCDGQVVTYGELHTRALQVATQLQALGVEPEVLVGVYLEDPISIAVAYFGIVTSGGVLVALDTEWPDTKLHEVIRDVNPKFIITDAHCAASIPVDSPRLLTFSLLDTPRSEAVFQRPQITPNNAAYVVFTSGSTGVPKGIIGLHRTITSSPSRSRPPRKDEIFTVTNLVFGAGVVGLFFPLIQGAAVLIVSRMTTRDLQAMVRLWETANVTRIVLVAPQLRQLSLLGSEVRFRLRNVTTVALSGAVLTPELLSDVYPLFPQATIINAYSCLEVGTMITRWESSPETRDRKLSVGRVLPNIRVYILGRKHNLMPPGFPGEIYVGSADLSRGYLNRPEWTNERFIPNPFDDPAIRLMYRTGDLGRLLSNGELEYLGRIDNQVKLRGNRVELEEIEAALQRNPEVYQAAVVAVHHGSELRLIAFVEAKPTCAPLVGSLRAHLVSCLPPFMIPALFVLISKLPMTGNGKIDRQNLPKINTKRPEIDTLYVAPRNPVEAAVAAVWEKELGFEGIGVCDHLLEIGGDSLIAIRIALGIEESLGRTIPIVSIFEYPTIEGLSAEIQKGSRL